MDKASSLCIRTEREQVDCKSSATPEEHAVLAATSTPGAVCCESSATPEEHAVFVATNPQPLCDQRAARAI
eukprot:1983418-Amphidinium_carterae.1